MTTTFWYDAWTWLSFVLVAAVAVGLFVCVGVLFYYDVVVPHSEPQK